MNKDNHANPEGVRKDDRMKLKRVKDLSYSDMKVLFAGSDEYLCKCGGNPATYTGSFKTDGR